MVDMFSRIEDQRLAYIRRAKIAELEQFDVDSDEPQEVSDNGTRFTLPASFTGSPKYYANKVSNCFTLARAKGKPDLFITLTCNPEWPEIKCQLGPGQAAQNVPQISP